MKMLCGMIPKKNKKSGLVPVYLNVYDLTGCTTINGCAYWLGLGVYHSGVQVHGVEYAFEGHDDDTTGVFEVELKQCPGYTFRKSILIGRTDLGAKEVGTLIENLSKDYVGNTYNRMSKNCNHFSKEFSKLITGKPIPSWVNRLAQLGRLCKCVSTSRLTTLDEEKIHPISSDNEIHEVDVLDIKVKELVLDDKVTEVQYQQQDLQPADSREPVPVEIKAEVRELGDFGVPEITVSKELECLDSSSAACQSDFVGNSESPIANADGVTSLKSDFDVVHSTGLEHDTEMVNLEQIGKEEVSIIPLEESVIHSFDGQNAKSDMVRRLFYYLFRNLSFVFVTLGAKIKIFEKKVEHKTRYRDAVQTMHLKKKVELRFGSKLAMAKQREIDSALSLINLARNAIAVEDVVDSRVLSMDIRYNMKS